MALELAASLGAKRRALAVRCLRSKDLGRSLTLESEATHMHLSPSPWSNDRIDQLKRCFDAGLTCSQIAREIGVTRNAVIGKMNRMGLVAAQGRDRQTAGAKASRKACAPEDSKDLAPEAPTHEHLRPT